jgi:hypothetical protein
MNSLFLWGGAFSALTLGFSFARAAQAPQVPVGIPVSVSEFPKLFSQVAPVAATVSSNPL